MCLCSHFFVYLISKFLEGPAIRRVRSPIKFALMAYTGQIITHPGMGVTMKFIKTHQETNGVGWEVEYTLAPGKGSKFPTHTHLHSDEWFQVIAGRGRYWLNGKVYKCAPGDEIYFPAGKPHIHPWNATYDPLVMRNILLLNDPSIDAHNEVKKMEDYVEHWFHLACRGHVRKNGNPYILQSAVFMRAIGKQIRVAKIPAVLHKTLITPLAFTGRLLGYKGTYYE